MSEQQSHTARIKEIADEFGVRFGITSAERSRVIAEQLIAEGNQEYIFATVADGVGVCLRREDSQERQTIQRGSIDAALATLNGQKLARQLELDYPITVAGEKSIQLRHATAADIRLALRMIESQREGISRTERQLRHFLSILSDFPESETVESLISRNAVSVGELFGRAA